MLLSSGNLRGGSINTALLGAMLALVPESVQAKLYGGLADLAHFNPDDDCEPLSTAVSRLRASVEQADAALFWTPEDAGALPRSFKNLLEGIIRGGELDPNRSPGSMRPEQRWSKTLARIPLGRQHFGPDGLIADPKTWGKLRTVLKMLAERMCP